ncbi:hypothetical protein PS2_031418 [Malus domestica]
MCANPLCPAEVSRLGDRLGPTASLRGRAMTDTVKQILAKPVQLADQVTKVADEASSSKQECLELKSKTKKLGSKFKIEHGVREAGIQI